MFWIIMILIAAALVVAIYGAAKNNSLLWISTVLLCIVCALFATGAGAATGLAVVCPVASSAGARVQSGCGGITTQSNQVYKTPTATDLVRVDPDRTAGQGADWAATNTNFTWKQFGQLANGELYERCNSDVPENTPVMGTPRCTAWAFAAKTAVTVPPAARIAQVTIRWIPPTSNTDGTSPASVTGYRIYSAVGTAPFTSHLIELDANAREYVITGLQSGVYRYAMTAVNGSVESDKSGEVTRTVDLSKPGAPTNVSAEVSFAP